VQTREIRTYEGHILSKTWNLIPNRIETSILPEWIVSALALIHNFICERGSHYSRFCTLWQWWQEEDIRIAEVKRKDLLREGTVVVMKYIGTKSITLEFVSIQLLAHSGMSRIDMTSLVRCAYSECSPNGERNEAQLEITLWWTQRSGTKIYNLCEWHVWLIQRRIGTIGERHQRANINKLYDFRFLMI
jgi:hypothetical protein